MAHPSLTTPSNCAEWQFCDTAGGRLVLRRPLAKAVIPGRPACIAGEEVPEAFARPMMSPTKSLLRQGVALLLFCHCAAKEPDESSWADAEATVAIDGSAPAGDGATNHDGGAKDGQAPDGGAATADGSRRADGQALPEAFLGPPRCPATALLCDDFESAA